LLVEFISTLNMDNWKIEAQAVLIKSEPTDQSNAGMFVYVVNLY